MKIPHNIIADIEVELDVAEKLHPNYPNDPLRRVAIVGEEAGESLRAALDLTRGYHCPSESARIRRHLQMELTQTAAMAIRALIAFGDDGRPQRD